MAQALQRSANALKTAGNDIDKSIALITAGNAVNQDYSSTAAGVRTISMRLAGVSVEELEEAGEDTEGLIETTAKLESTIKSLTAVNGQAGVEILDNNGALRSTYDILLDISRLWEDIKKQDKIDGKNRANALQEAIAGKNRASIFSSIMENPEMLEKVYETSSNSAGSAANEQNTYLESIQAHINTLQSKYQELWAVSVNRDFINFWLDAAGAVLDFTTAIGGVPTIISAIVGAVGSFKGVG